MKYIKPLVKRLVISVAPLVILYFIAEMSFKANRQSEHPVDAGLGIAFLLIFIIVVLFIGFFIDLIVRLRKKSYSTVGIDLLFLLPILFAIFYFGCQMGAFDYACNACFCGQIIKVGSNFLP